MKPFAYLVSEDEFVTRLIQLLRETVVLPADDKWHEIRLTFDIFCDGAKPDGSFLLGDGHAR